MRRRLFPLLVLFTLVLAALLGWLWSTDAVLKAKCRRAGGAWDAEARGCMLDLSRSPA
jgi:hypothetical protein